MLDARDLPDGQRLTTDICIVGAGAAGITLATELVGTGIDVLLLESGGLRLEREAQDYNAGSVVDERLHGPPDRYRRRRFGGWMNEHESRCTALSSTDFEQRSYMPNSGWPFAAETLQPFYARALAMCESDESQKTWERDRESLHKPLIEGFDGHNFNAETLDRYGSTVNFGARYADALRNSGNVCTVLNATVTRLQLNAEGTQLESLIFRTLGGKAISVKATRFVIAAGAMETARLLLVNRDVHPNGVGNDHDIVGRFYMCPPEGTAGIAALKQTPNAAWFGSARSDIGLRSRRRLVLKPESQQALQIGNFAARLYPVDSDFTAAGSRSLWSTLRSKTPRTHRFLVGFQAEQQANVSSRITLGDNTDSLGMPRIVVDWNCNVTDFETVRLGMAKIAEDLERSGTGQLLYEPSALASAMTCHGPHGGNHLGTARMGSHPDVSVVDANCRMHGVQNLYLAGGAVFPSSGLGDPMLTLVALSLRLSDHLKAQVFQAAQPKRLINRFDELRPPRPGPRTGKLPSQPVAVGFEKSA